MTYSMNGCSSCQPCGEYITYPGFGGIADTFDAAQVWADAEEGGRGGQYQAALSKLDCNVHAAECGAVQKMISNANFRGLKAADAIRAALNELGYGPLNLGVAWSGADKAAWKAFTSKHGLPSGPGLVNKAGIYKLEEELTGTSTAGMGGLGWALLLLAGAAATVALVSGRRKGKKTPTGRAQIRLS